MRIEQLTFTRFLAAIAIVIFHYGTSIPPFDSLNFIVKKANNAVSYFFVLSGFVMIIAYYTKKRIRFKDYLIRRYLRIYPVFLVSLLLLLFFYLSTSRSINYHEFILSVFLVQSWFPGNALVFNAPAWSLSVEMFFYMTFPFLVYYFYKRYSLLITTICIVVVFISSQVFLHLFLKSAYYPGGASKAHDFIYYFPLMHFNEFLMGNLAGMFFLSKKMVKKNYDLSISLLVLLLIILLTFSFGIVFHNGMLAILFVPLLILFSCNTGGWTRLFRYKAFVFLGEISYAIYILQYPVFVIVKNCMTELFKIKNTTIIFYTSLLVLVSFSAICYWYVEKPIRNRIKNKEKHRRKSMPY